MIRAREFCAAFSSRKNRTLSCGSKKESSAALLTLSPASLSPVLASRLVLGEGVATGRSIPQQIVTMQSYKPTKVQLVHEKLLSVLVSTTMFIITLRDMYIKIGAFSL